MDGAERTVFTAKKGDTGLWQRGPDWPTGARLKREAAKRHASGAENRIFPVAFRNWQSGPERGKACDAKESIPTTPRRQRPVRRPRDGAGKPSGARTPGRLKQADCPMRCPMRCRFSALPHRHHLKKGNFVSRSCTSPFSTVPENESSVRDRNLQVIDLFGLHYSKQNPWQNCCQNHWQNGWRNHWQNGWRNSCPEKRYSINRRSMINLSTLWFLPGSKPTGIDRSIM